MGDARICVVGAGNIANTHATVLQDMHRIVVTAIVDPNLAAAQALAKQFPGAKAFATVDEALAGEAFDRAHVLVPPPLHETVAGTLLRNGKSVLCEKPLCTTSKGCENLLRLARENNAVLGTNQNFLFNPAFRQLLELVRTRAHGPLRYVNCIFNMPLRQLAAKQLSHWMFDKPLNMLLEQAVHPLSLIRALIGEVSDITTTMPKGATVSPGVPLYTNVDIALTGTESDAQLHFAVGADYPFWQILAVCDDGVITADLITNRIFTAGRTRYPEFADAFLTGRQTALQILRQSRANAANYILSLLRLKTRSDPFYLSMAGSIRSFHDACSNGRTPEADGEFGADLVRICEKIADKAFPAPDESVRPQREPKEQSDVVLLGGTGFIGKHTVRKIRDAGLSVAVMARNLNNLDEIFFEDGVSVFRGNVTDSADIQRAVGRAPIVVNLAHGGGGASWDDVQRSMVGSARLVGTACLAAKTKRLIHIGSIAGLYLGGHGDTIDGRTPPDPKAELRADYSRGKAEADRALLQMHHAEKLPVCILRPGVVLGDGTSPFHSGLGFYNNLQFCLGWNEGQNAIPFVLAEDVADAIVASLSAQDIEGRCYNLVGDVRPTASEFIEELARRTGRPIHFFPQSVHKLFAVDIGKWLIKKVIGRKGPFPSLRDIESRGMKASFDCSDAKADLGWMPVSDRMTFLDAAIPNVKSE